MQQVIAAATPLQPAHAIPQVPPGRTVAEIVDLAIESGFLPDRFYWHGDVDLSHPDCPEGPMRVKRESWRCVRPKPCTIVHLYLSPAGGGQQGGGGKNILQAVTSVFLLIGTAAISGGALSPFLGGAFAAGRFGAKALAAGVGLAGQLAARSLFPPPQIETQSGEDSVRANRASIRDNLPARGQTLPRVVGTHRIALSPIMRPHQYFLGDDVYVNAIYAAAGAHAMTDVRVDDVPADDLDDFEYWIDDGTAPARVNRFSEYAFTDNFNREISRHKLRGDEDGFNEQDLINQAEPNKSLPPWERFRTRRSCDYADVNLAFVSMYDAGVGAENQIVYLRLRGRKAGESQWQNVQTFCYVGRSQNLRNRRMRLYFKKYPGDLLGDPLARDGFREPVTLPPVDYDHLNFKTTDTDRFAAAHNFDFVLRREGIDVWLNDDYWLDDNVEYEWEIKRSEMVEQSEFSNVDEMEVSSGALGAGVYDFFDAVEVSGAWRAREVDTDQSERIILQSVVSVYEAPPIPGNAQVATLHVRLKNFEASNITVTASGLVPDLVGGNWEGQVATSNPASHYRYMLTGKDSVERVDAAYIDDVIDDWHAECAAQGYECNDVLDGTLDDGLKRVAACGRARPSFGLKYGVVYDRDTTSEGAVQMFTPRNTRNLSWQVAYTRRPTGFNVEFINRDNNYEQDELFVADPFAISGATTDIESVRYPGLVTEQQVRSRAEFDFEQARFSTLYTFDIGIEHLATAPGDIAILSHDALHQNVAWGRVTSVIDATHIVVDVEADVNLGGSFFDEPDFFAIPDLFSVGAEWGVAVRDPDGSVITQEIVSWDAGTRTIEMPDASGVSSGDLVTIGSLNNVVLRVIVVSVEASGLDLATVTVRPEVRGEQPNYLASQRALSGDQSGKRILSGDQIGARRLSGDQA